MTKVQSAILDLGAAFGKPPTTVERIASQWVGDLAQYPEGLVCQVLDEIRLTETHWPSLAAVISKIQGAQGMHQKPQGCEACDTVGTLTVYWHTTAGGVPTQWAARCLCAAGEHYRRSFPTVSTLLGILQAKPGHLEAYVSTPEGLERWKRMGKDHPQVTQ